MEQPADREGRRLAVPSRARTRGAAPSGASTGQTVGAVLRRLRGEYGLGTRRLAKRSAVSRRAIQYFEDGSIRPRRCTLAALAYGLEPDNEERRRQILPELVAAAGGEDALARDGRWPQYRAQRFERGLLDGSVALPAPFARQLALNQRADQLMGTAYRLTDELTARRGWMEDGAAMERISAMLTEARRLHEEAGGPVVLQVGGRRIVTGFGPVP